MTKIKTAPIEVYLTCDRIFGRDSWCWVRCADDRAELIGYESEDDARNGLALAKTQGFKYKESWRVREQ